MCALSLIEKEAIILENDADPQRILNILIELQFASEEGYIDQETAQLVAEHLHLTEARVYEIVLKICNSTPCHYTGGAMVAEVLETILEVPENQPTPDGLFMYHSIPCIGACDLGPVIKIKDTVFSQLTEEKIYQLIQHLQNDCYEGL